MSRSALPVAQLRGGRGFARDPRFVSLVSASPGATEAERDPVAEAYQRGFADGAAQAEARAAEAEAERDACRAAIELAFARFDERSAADLRERLRSTVMALCEEAIMPHAIDAEGLAARIARAAAMLHRAQDERRVLIHPDDLPLVQTRLPADLALEVDASVERGGLRIETADGGIEDGPAQWRRILSEAFREC
jgi:flagellar assembly protein FliH